jgi:hypothetical protein
MPISLGIRLVIMFPTILFILGFSFKAIIERRLLKSLKRDVREEACQRLSSTSLNDFFFILGIDSVFLSIANGLIIVFELGHIEPGLVALILGLIFSMCVLIGVYANHHIAIVGILGIFGILGGELAYFTAFESGVSLLGLPLESAVFIIGFVLGTALGGPLAYLAYPTEEQTVKMN